MLGTPPISRYSPYSAIKFCADPPTSAEEKRSQIVRGACSTGGCERDADLPFLRRTARWTTDHRHQRRQILLMQQNITVGGDDDRLLAARQADGKLRHFAGRGRASGRVSKISTGSSGVAAWATLTTVAYAASEGLGQSKTTRRRPG